MTSKRLYFVLMGVSLLLVLGIIGGAYGTNSLLSTQSQKLVAQKAKLASLQQEQIELTKSKKDIATYTDLYNISKAIVPQSKDQTQTVRQIVELASNTGVTLQSITFPASDLGGSALSTTGTTTVPAPAAGSPVSPATNPALSQLVAVPDIPGVYDLELTVTSSTDTGHLATFSQMINFLAALEQNRLTALVSKITIQPATNSDGSTESGLYSFVLTLDVYIKPGI
jgi:cell division protein FtsB